MGIAPTVWMVFKHEAAVDIIKFGAVKPPASGIRNLKNLRSEFVQSLPNPHHRSFVGLAPKQLSAHE